MLNRPKATDWWVYVPAGISLAIMYVTTNLPALAWTWITLFSASTLLLKIDRDFTYVKFGILGCILLWVAIYLLIATPNVAISDTLYYFVYGSIIVALLLLALFTFKRHWRLREDFENRLR